MGTTSIGGSRYCGDFYGFFLIGYFGICRLGDNIDVRVGSFVFSRFGTAKPPSHALRCLPPVRLSLAHISFVVGN